MYKRIYNWLNKKKYCFKFVSFFCKVDVYFCKLNEFLSGYENWRFVLIYNLIEIECCLILICVG